MRNICVMRDIYRALGDFEQDFEKIHGVGLNEAMVLCCLGDSTLSSGEIAESTGMTCSHTSKTIGSVEKKELIERALGERDKRQMYFHLTAKGRECLQGMVCGSVPVPDILKPIFEKNCNKE